LYAALDVKSGKVHGKTAARHTSEEFIDFLGQVVGLCRPKQEIHIIVDNLSAHKNQNVREFLESHPQVKPHLASDDTTHEPLTIRKNCQDWTDSAGRRNRCARLRI
jgi:hypothetical protein